MKVAITLLIIAYLVAANAAPSRQKGKWSLVKAKDGCKIKFCGMLKVYRPVCGSDGKTYAQPCMLTNAQCDNPGLTKERNGDCEGKMAARHKSIMDSLAKTYEAAGKVLPTFKVTIG